MPVRGHVHRHAVDARGEVGAVVELEVEAAQEILVRLAVATVLRDDDPGHEFQHLARALGRAALQQFTPDGAGRCRVLRAVGFVVVALHDDSLRCTGHGPAVVDQGGGAGAAGQCGQCGRDQSGKAHG